MSDKRTATHAWLIIALCIVVVSLLAGCYRVVPTTIEIEPWKPCDMSSYCQIGQVVCSEQNQPVIVVRKGLPPDEMPYTLLHEGVHRLQLKSNCFQVRNRFRTDSVFRFQMELEAYCVEYGERLKKGASPELVIGTLSALLSTLYGVSEDDITCPWLQKTRG